MSTLNDEKLCTNKTFWENKPCGGGGVRCTGNYPGECSIILNLQDIPCSQKKVLVNDFKKVNCKDNSNLVCSRYKFNNAICSQSLMHMCNDNVTCIHENLVCDGYTHCPDGSDEIEEVCKACPRAFGFPLAKLKGATFACKHRYTGRFICSIPCDGEDDLCLDNDDEKCQQDNIIIIGIAVVILILLTITIGEIIFMKLKINETEVSVLNKTHTINLIGLLNSPRKMEKTLIYRLFMPIHDAQDYSTTLSLLMTYFTIHEKSLNRELARCQSISSTF